MDSRAKLMWRMSATLSLPSLTADERERSLWWVTCAVVAVRSGERGHLTLGAAHVWRSAASKRRARGHTIT